MLNPKYGLLFGLILALLLGPISGRKGGGSHSYPKSNGGLSGGGHRSGGLSGGGHGYASGGSHGYPSGGMSGGSHGYPSGGMSGGSHGYPSGGMSGGGHGYPSGGMSGGSRNYPSQGSHSYPSATSKPHSYPSGGLSGGGSGYSANKNTGHTTNVYNYHYSPPARITYTSPHGGAPTVYPVYRGQPPTYVYQYKDSGSKYGTLLAGLALMNLGTLGVASYAAVKANQNHGTGSYKSQPGEVCKFAIKKENGDYEETRINCEIISGLVLQDTQPQSTKQNSTITTITTVTNTTIVNNTNIPSETTTVSPNVLYQFLPNGTLVPVNVTNANNSSTSTNVTQNVPNAGSVSSVVTTTTTTNTTQLVSAEDVKGKPVVVTPGMQCFITRKTPTSLMSKTVPCGVLQSYAEQSLKRNSATRTLPMFTVLAAAVAYCVV